MGLGEAAGLMKSFGLGSISDLKTFETRFDSMARHVRKIGIDTKYTAVEIAGAVR